MKPFFLLSLLFIFFVVCCSFVSTDSYDSEKESTLLSQPYKERRIKRIRKIEESEIDKKYDGDDKEKKKYYIKRRRNENNNERETNALYAGFPGGPKSQTYFEIMGDFFPEPKIDIFPSNAVLNDDDLTYKSSTQIPSSTQKYRKIKKWKKEEKKIKKSTKETQEKYTVSTFNDALNHSNPLEKYHSEDVAHSLENFSVPSKIQLSALDLRKKEILNYKNTKRPDPMLNEKKFHDYISNQKEINNFETSTIKFIKISDKLTPSTSLLNGFTPIIHKEKLSTNSFRIPSQRSQRIHPNAYSDWMGIIPNLQPSIRERLPFQENRTLRRQIGPRNKPFLRKQPPNPYYINQEWRHQGGNVPRFSSQPYYPSRKFAFSSNQKPSPYFFNTGNK